MSSRPEADLKRPDLKGDFSCGSCGRKYQHAASLNRHRLTAHGNDQTCLLCNRKIHQKETVNHHMRMEHQLQTVWGCGCCNWTFPDKRQLNIHYESIKATGRPGAETAIAVSDSKPGSLSQRRVQSEAPTPLGKQNCSVNPPADSEKTVSDFIKSQALVNLFPHVGTQAPQAQSPNSSAEFSNEQLFANLLKMFQTNSPLASSSSGMEDSKTPEASTSSAFEDVLSGADENNIEYGENNIVITTDQPPSNSFCTDSGIASAEMCHSPTPVSTPPLSSEVSPTNASNVLMNKAKLSTKLSNKRRTIDEICSVLSKKRTNNCQ